MKDTIQERFDRYNAEHPEVYAEIVAIARKLREAGRTRYSIDAIVQVVRYHRDLQGTEEGGFKLNDHFRSRYARLIMDRERDLDGFFEIRRLTA